MRAACCCSSSWYLRDGCQGSCKVRCTVSEWLFVAGMRRGRVESKQSPAAKAPEVGAPLTLPPPLRSRGLAVGAPAGESTGELLPELPAGESTGKLAAGEAIVPPPPMGAPDASADGGATDGEPVAGSAPSLPVSPGLAPGLEPESSGLI